MAKGPTIPHEVVDMVLSRDISAVRAWREYLKLTPEEVAARLNIDMKAYTSLEQAEPADHDSLERIAAALGITFEQIDF